MAAAKMILRTMVGLLCMAPIMLLQTHAYAEDGAPTFEQCQALPHESELEALEAFRCQVLFTIYGAAFRNGTKTLRRWVSPLSVYVVNADNGQKAYVERYVASLSKQTPVKINIVNNKEYANTFVFFLTDMRTLVAKSSHLPLCHF